MTPEHLRGRIMLVGVTRRWRGLNRITFAACITDNEKNRAAVRACLEELVAEGRVEHELGPGGAEGYWRARR